jgi:hypothetical protein
MEDVRRVVKKSGKSCFADETFSITPLKNKEPARNMQKPPLERGK